MNKGLLFITVLILIIVAAQSLVAQELNCEVSINVQQSQFRDKSIFGTLEDALEEFMNSRSWIEDKFKTHERIDCSILITVNEYDPDNHTFKASATLQSSRPVYKASYNTVLMNHVDEDFNFTYQEYEPIVFNENNFRSNLSSFMAYYAFLIIALDYDSFSELGGDPYYEKAKTVVNNAQNTSHNGWSPDDNSRENRYWIVENYLSPTFEPLRSAIYKYHRKGLDIMHEDPKKGRKKVFESLKMLMKVHEKKPGSIVIQNFFNAKTDELVGIFQEGKPNIKQRAVQLLNKMDPTHSKKYRRILK